VVYPGRSDLSEYVSKKNTAVQFPKVGNVPWLTKIVFHDGKGGGASIFHATHGKKKKMA
jgi:hypothetical protein